MDDASLDRMTEFFLAAGTDGITILGREFERDGSMRHIAILTGNGGLFLDFELERGVLASDAQRKPALSLSNEAKAEVDYLLFRISSDRPASENYEVVTA